MLIVTLLCPPLCHMATSQWFKHDLEIVSCKHWAKSHDVLNILFFRFHESQYPIKKKETAWTSPVPKAKLPMCWWLFCYKAPTLSSCILSEEHHLASAFLCLMLLVYFDIIGHCWFHSASSPWSWVDSGDQDHVLWELLQGTVVCGTAPTQNSDSEGW